MTEFHGFCMPIGSNPIQGQAIRDLASQKATFAVQVSAEWCGACSTATPEIQQASCAFNDMTFYKMNGDDDDLGPLSIESLPSLAIFKNGNLMGLIEGAYNSDEYVTRIGLLLDGKPLPPDPE